MRRRWWIVGFVLLACASWIAASANGATGSVTVSMDVASVSELTNNCRGASATRFGTVQPGAKATTATGAGACQVSFGASNDTAALRMAVRDGAANAMGSTAAAWTQDRPGGTAMRAVARHGSTTVTAGMFGLIMRSVNGGSTWTEQWAVGSGDYIFDVEHLPGSNDVWLAGAGNAHLYYSTDVTSSAPGDPTWTDLRPQLTAAGWPGGTHVMGVSMLNASTWLVVGWNGWVAKTTTTGASWSAFQLPATTGLYDVHFLDASTAYIAGSESKLFTTSLGGDNAGEWNAQSHWCGCWWQALAVGSASQVYVASDAGYVARWNGSSFVTTAEMPDLQFEPQSLAVADSDPAVVFAGTSFGSVMRSTDSAGSFQRYWTEALGVVDGITAATATDAIAVGANQTISVTTNGTSWSRVYQDTTKQSIANIAADPVNGRRAVAVGTRGTVLRTTNGGSTWSSITSGTTAHLLNVAWLSSSTVVAVGQGGAVIRSTDAGATWTTGSSGTSTDLLAVAGSDTTAWAVGPGGLIVRSTNSGASWSAQSSGTTESLEGIASHGSQRAWAVGIHGTVRWTTNGGATWNAGTGLPAWAQASDVAAVDASTVVLSTRFSGSYRSTNGGATWAHVPTSEVGWEIDAEGPVVATLDKWGGLAVSTDGGATFAPRVFPFGSTDILATISLDVVDERTMYLSDDLGYVLSQDENSAASAQVADYAGGATFASSPTTGTFGVCLQGLASASAAGTWVADGGTCTAVDTDPWKPVPTTPETVATAASGITGTATFVWGVGPRLDQPPGNYSAAVVFEAVAPAA